MKTLTTALLLCITFVAWYLSALPRYYKQAKKTGLPIHFTPVSPANPLWLVTTSILGYSALERYLPKFLFDAIKITIVGWEARCYYEVNQRYGTNFVLVSPGCNTIFVADPEVGDAILMRRKDFGRIEISTRILAVFGPNLTSSDHDEWKRHRRIVAPILNERIMNAVWDESKAQVFDMLSLIERSSTGGKSSAYASTPQDMKTITINVIGSVGFGTSQKFSSTASIEPPQGFSTTSMSSILLIVNNFFVTVLVPAKVLLLPFMPKFAKQLGTAKVEFPLHLQKSIAKERQSPGGRNTLISTLVRVADESGGESSKNLKTSTYMTEEEITGNLFNFTIAGFDTTANTLTYAIMELAIHPEWQEWIIQGIDAASKAQPNGEYAATFPLLSRCLALMFETLRLHTPVTHVARYTHQVAQTVQDIEFPPETIVQISFQVIHASPKIWGEDCLVFRPDRWTSGGQPNHETLLEPGRGEFMPWSTGPRFCPGVKMAQVEFVAVIQAIFGAWKVEVVEGAGETQAEARKRLARTVADSSPKLTMQMVRPQDAVLRWVRR